MAYTADDLAALEKLFKSGVKRVRYKDREIEYRDLDEIRQAVSTVNQQVNAAPSHRLIAIDRDW